jgi:hypothetical protein
VAKALSAKVVISVCCRVFRSIAALDGPPLVDVEVPVLYCDASLCC